MATKCGWASIGSNGSITGDTAGDQNGKEVKVGDYYDFGQNVVYRFKNRELAKKYASYLEEVCNNDHVGYNQNNRASLYRELKKVSWKIEELVTDCDCDCSALVGTCLVAIGLPVNSQVTTSGMDTELMGSGFFTKLTESKYYSTGDYLLVGDIINNAGHHVITALENGKKATETPVLDKSNVVNSNKYLTVDQMKPNAKYVAQYLYLKGWTKEAIAGILGNMQKESNINPGLWQSLDALNWKMGFGLVQWTPATKLKEWADKNNLDYTDIDTQLARIIWEISNGDQYIKTSAYDLTFKEFTQSTMSPEWLCSAFMRNYERPASYSTEEERQCYSRYWYDLMISEGWFEFENTPSKPVEPPAPDVPDTPPTVEGSLYELICKTSFNVKSISVKQREYLESKKLGDTCYIRFTFHRNKKIGTNWNGNRLTIDTSCYTICSVKSNGFIVIRYRNGLYKYVNPNYIKD